MNFALNNNLKAEILVVDDTLKGKGEMMTYWLLGKARHFETSL